MIKLSNVGEVEFKRYKDFIISDNANEITQNFNLTLEQALEESKMMIDDMFKDGLATEGQYVHNIIHADSNEQVGFLWYNVIPEISAAYLYHILINENHRGKGFGTNTIEKLQDKLKAHGVKSIGLSVFGKNEGAYRLYKKLGYSNTRISMEKTL
ncbi:GNAT family N-acetyltransferase [Sporosarcina sp. BI001-red]|uniref:GNAT family N-acetyltransferase n=1 Tax=Sporosarcina sp. BI001-red TaxID=2282866 RepID=UPI000E26589A|nr:GNAT family N-acetyltransferase [Sporosarcina sp. BI001-red]REB07339.1 GNAT family N-acetyltransferase [Sporosarcina sp. BI001-red]